ncbi:MAG: hypothetical protein LBD09_05305 [Treponema sp.]|nr:hypothetical protein [Treponema sp.]
MMNRDELLRLVPPALRARAWRLYTVKGRLVDLWQWGGRALLGHKPPGLLRALKNDGNRGLFVPLPQAAEGRLRKALGSLFPRRAFRLYPDESALASALAAAGYAPPAMYAGGIYNVYTSGAGKPPGKAVLWRPFLDGPAAVPAIVPALPFPFPGAPAVLSLDPAVEGSFPPAPVLSPLALTAAARCVWDLAAAADRGKPRFPRLEKIPAEGRRWKRRGIYLEYTGSGGQDKPDDEGGGDYAATFRRFLDGGFLLPPGPEEPAILPGELSPGEEAKLAELLSD